MRELKNSSTHEQPRALRPLLMVDVDGVISLFGALDGLRGRPPGSAAADERLAREGSFHSIDGIPHFLSATAAAHLLELADAYELVWASGWEEKANEHLPRLLGLPRELPFIRFTREQNANRTTHAHWKLAAIDRYAGSRPLAWIDDAFNDACHAWAQARESPTLLVSTTPAEGLTQRQAQELQAWAVTLQRH